MYEFKMATLKHLFRFPTKLKSFKLLLLFISLIIIYLVTRNNSPSKSEVIPRVSRALTPVEQDDFTSKTTCRFHTCFDINRCTIGEESRISVHVYDHYTYSSSGSEEVYRATLSSEYEALLTAVRESVYYEPDPSKACLFVVSFDTLSQPRLETKLASVILHSQPQWNHGENHLVFNMIPGTAPSYNVTPDFYYGKAILAGGSFSRGSYRSTFDISIPVYNTLTRDQYQFTASAHHDRPRLLTVLTHGWYSQDTADKLHLLLHENSEDVLLLDTSCSDYGIAPEQLSWQRCSPEGNVYPYLPKLRESQFCLLIPGLRLGSPDLLDILMTGCVPVLLDDDYVLPFSEVLDWTQGSVRCWSHDLVGVASKLRDMPRPLIREMRERVLFFYEKYFSSMRSITLTTLDIINERVFPSTAKGTTLWTTGLLGNKHSAGDPDVDLLTSLPNEGFTAVILTYNRVKELFEAIVSVSAAPSLVKVLIVWNNVDSEPPSSEQWPQIRQPIQVIRSKENRLSNRFYPYPEIKTAAVFSLDDDITMLTADELEFGFKAWQEFPNRLVGFPGRVHSKVGSKWKYESSWLNNISLVLTGAAFYHNYYNYVYSHVMPARIRQWVDKHMNCEDIAMNFLIANHTALPPIKISPRKKFTCPTCTQEESLWNDPGHYRERNECLNIFEHFFKGMPLKTVKFRLDPVLYKEPLPDHNKAFPDIGKL